MKIRFVSVDPGVTTGVVAVDFPLNWEENDLYLGLRGAISSQNCREYELLGDASAQVDELIRLIMPPISGSISCEVVFIEDFIPRIISKDRSFLAPVRVTERLDDRLYCQGWNGSIVMQSPSDAKSIVTDARLRSWGLWVAGSNHVRDAWRHLVKGLRDKEWKGQDG